MIPEKEPERRLLHLRKAALKIPFVISNAQLMDTFLSFIDELFVAKSKFISKPQLLKAELYDLETQYQQINLYYSFSRAFGLEFDEQWVYDTRIKISEGINEILRGI